MPLDFELQLEQAEKQIYDESKNYNYISKEWDIEMIYNKFTNGFELDQTEIFVPHYQRGFVRSKKEQSKFIESLLLGIPIPYIFLSSENDLKNDDGRKEIIDGAQRIQTIHAFLSGELKLESLEKLEKLNGISYNEFSLGRKRKINNIPIRVVLLSGLSEETKRDMFKRINTTSNMLKHMEIRKGSIGGPFYELLKTLSQNEIFLRMCPLNDKKLKREHDIELLLRFYAYSERFSKYKSKVAEFLTDYMVFKTDQMIAIIDEYGDDSDEYSSYKLDLVSKMEKTFLFIEENFPNGFRKKSSDKVLKSNTYFEAIAVGSLLALNEVNFQANELQLRSIGDWIVGGDFKNIVSSDSANNKAKFEGRISYVKDQLLTV